MADSCLAERHLQAAYRHRRLSCRSGWWGV